MQVDLTRSGWNKRYGGKFPVKSWADASAHVLEYIARHDLGAGCSEQGDAFIGGDVFDDEDNKIGRVSYNGRCWDLNGKEIV